MPPFMILFYFLDIENITFKNPKNHTILILSLKHYLSFTNHLNLSNNKHFSLFRTANKLAKGKELFQKKPLGRRWYLISSPVRGCEFSTATSGTERERGFVGIVPSLCESFIHLYTKQLYFKLKK